MEKTFYIRATNVEDGMFSNERIVSLTVEDKNLTLIVDSGDVVDRKLRVSVLQQQSDRVLIDLPREPITGPGRMVVPSSMLIE